MFRTSESTAKLDAALAKVQGEVKKAAKDQKNQHHGWTYADLSSIYVACREALAKYEVSVTQWPVHSDDNRLHLVTRLAHEGEWMLAEMSAPYPPSIKGSTEIQLLGGAITYTRKYALAAAIGVVSDEDVDSGAGRDEHTDRMPPKPAEPKTVPPEVEAQIVAKIEKAGTVEEITKALNDAAKLLPKGTPSRERVIAAASQRKKVINSNSYDPVTGVVQTEAQS